MHIHVKSFLLKYIIQFLSIIKENLQNIIFICKVHVQLRNEKSTYDSYWVESSKTNG